MAIFVFGRRHATIGMDEFLLRCPSCESHQYADVMILSNYYHLYFIPIFPFDKHANIICNKCGYKRYGVAFDDRIFSNYEEIKRKYRHPFYTYTGIVILGIVLIGSVLSFLLA